MVCSDEEEFSYEGSYFEEEVELSEEEEEEEDNGEDTRNGVKELNGGTTPHHQEQPPTTTEQANNSAVEKTAVEKPLEESESYVEEEEEEDDEYIIEEFVEENYEVPLAGSEEEAADHGEDETSFDDNSTAYDPDDDAPIITDETTHRQSTSTELEIGKYSDHSMDVDNTFELNLPFIPKSKQMSAVTLDWDYYQDSTSSWGAWGSDEESDYGNDDTGARPIIVMDEQMQETEGGTANDGPKLGVARNKSGGKLGRRSSFQRTLSGGLPSRGSLARNNSGNLRGAIDRTHSGGLVRPMPVLLASSGMARRKSHGHLIMSPLDTLAEEGATQLSPFVNPEDKINLSRETFSGFDSKQLPPPPPPTDSDNSEGSSDEFAHESHESTEKKDANNSISQTEEDEQTKSAAAHHNLDAQTNDQILADPQIDADVQNHNLVNIQSMTIHDGELPGEHSTRATMPIHTDSRESTMERGIHPTIPAENPNNGSTINNGDLERLSRDATTISTLDKDDSPPEPSVAGTLGNGNHGDYKKDDNDTAFTKVDRLTNTTPSSINVRPPIPSSSTKAGTQNPVTPSPSRPSPGSITEKSMKQSRSIDQLRRSSHLNLPRLSNHSQSSLPRRASKRNSNNTSSPGLNSDVASPKAGKVSRFEQLLKRSSAIKAVR